MLASLATQIQNAKLWLHLRSAFGFFNLTSLGDSVVFQGPDNYILFFLFWYMVHADFQENLWNEVYAIAFLEKSNFA